MSAPLPEDAAAISNRNAKKNKKKRDKKRAKKAAVVVALPGTHSLSLPDEWCDHTPRCTFFIIYCRAVHA
jgi:hypothetical protein